MNIFRFVADMLHVCAICILAYRIKKSRNCIGLSCKTQEIYLIVFCMRYVDLFMYYISLYNTLMKVFFISATAFIVYLMRFKKPYCTVSIWFILFLTTFTFLDLRLYGRRLPSPESAAPCGFGPYVLGLIRVERLGADLVFLPLVGGARFPASNHYAQ